MTESTGHRTEKRVRGILEAYLHTSLDAQQPVETTGGRHRFDLVSEKAGIFVEVKSTKYPKEEKSLPTKVGDISRDILLLLGVKRAKRCLLVLTNKKFFEYFTQKAKQAKIADSRGVEIVLVESKGRIKRPNWIR